MTPNNKRTKTQIIFISISAPLIMRNMLIQPESVLDRLKAEKHLTIVLLVPESAYEKMREDFEEEKVIIEPVFFAWRVKKLSQKLYNFFATYLIFTEGARLFAWHGIRLDKPVAGGKKGRFLYPVKLLIANTFGKSKWIKTRFCPWLDGRVYRERPHKELFEKYKPDLIFLPDILSVQDVGILREAGRQGIKTIGVPGSWDHLPKRFEPLHVDRLVVWAEPFKKEAMELHNYDAKDISISGIPQYDLFANHEYILPREKFLRPFGLDSNQKLISFFSGSSYTPDDGDIVSMLVEFMKTKQFAADVQLFIRPYPAIPKDHEKFDIFNNESSIYIDWIEPQKIFPHKGNRWYPTINALTHLMNIMYHSDVIINTYSSVSVEASVFAKPIININFDGYQKRPFSQSIQRFKHLSHYKHVLETGGVCLVHSKDELLKSINEFLKNPKANKENTLTLQEKMCWRVDGKASERIADQVLQALE